MAMEPLFDIATEKPLSGRVRRALENAIERQRSGARYPVSFEWLEGPVPILELQSPPVRCRILFAPGRAGVFWDCPAWIRALASQDHLDRARGMVEAIFDEAGLTR